MSEHKNDMFQKVVTFFFPGEIAIPELVLGKEKEECNDYDDCNQEPISSSKWRRVQEARSKGQNM